MSDEQECLVTTSGEELGDIGGSWAVGKMLVDGCGRLERSGNHGAGFGAAACWRGAEGAHVGASGNERRRKSGGLLDPL